MRGCESEWRDWLGDKDPNAVYQMYVDCITPPGANANTCLEQSVTGEEKDYAWEHEVPSNSAEVQTTKNGGNHTTSQREPEGKQNGGSLQRILPE